MDDVGARRCGLSSPTLEVEVSTVLVVEDEPIIREAIIEELSLIDWDFTVTLPIQQSVDTFYNILNEIIAANVPLTKSHKNILTGTLQN